MPSNATIYIIITIYQLFEMILRESLATDRIHLGSNDNIELLRFFRNIYI